MGDAGSNLLGFLLGCSAIIGAVKTQAALALVFPFLILAVPVLDTAFVVLKRLKYRQPVYHADREHFHHRLDRIGFSVRKTVLLLYGWTFAMASVAVISRFVQPFNSDGDLRWDNAIILGTLFLLALAASVFRGLRARDPEVRARRPTAPRANGRPGAPRSRGRARGARRRARPHDRRAQLTRPARGGRAVRRVA